ncbi:MAG TPA: hypothetical protein VF821_01625 [Lentzea sp.]
MTPTEWSYVAGRISAFWPPALTVDQIGAYYEILDQFSETEALAAVRAIAATSREKRPTAGLIRETALRLSENKVLALPEPRQRGDVLSTAEHGAVLAMVARMNTPEQLRRAEILKSLIGRVKLAEMWTLMRLPTAKSFDAAVEKYQPAVQESMLAIPGGDN